MSLCHFVIVTISASFLKSHQFELKIAPIGVLNFGYPQKLSYLCAVNENTPC